MAAASSNPDTPGVPATDRVARFFIWCAGADPDLLTETSERRWYTSLGASVVLTATLAGLAMSVLVSVAFSSLSWFFVLFIALFWAALVFNIDRLIVSKIPSDPSKLTKVGLYTARFLMALIIAVTVSEGLILTVFSPEVQRQVDKDNQGIITDAEADARTRFDTEINAINARADRLQQAVTAADTSVDDAATYFGCEINPTPDCVGVTGTPGEGPETAAARAELQQAREQRSDTAQARDEYLVTLRPVTFTPEQLVTCGQAGATQMTQHDIELCQVEIKIADAASDSTAAVGNQDGLLKRIVALTNMGKGEDGTTVWAARILIFLALTTIELVPLSAKVFGGVSSHDAKVRAKAYRREPHFLDRDLGGFNAFGRNGWGPKWYARERKKVYQSELFDIQQQAMLSEARANAEAQAAANARGRDATATAHNPAANPLAAAVPAPAPARAQTPTTHAATEVLGRPTEVLTRPAATLNPGLVLASSSDPTLAVRLVAQLSDPASAFELWRCETNATDRPQVAKVARTTNTASAQFGALLADTKAAAANHPNIIEVSPVVHIDDAAGVSYVLMPYYRDGDLRAFLQHNRNLPLQTVLSVTRQVLEGLSAWQRGGQGLHHGDIKPGNILIDLSGGTVRAVLTDFGIAKLRAEMSVDAPNAFEGTSAYAPLEQIFPTAPEFGGYRGPASDLWSVAAVLYEMVTRYAPRYPLEVQAGLASEPWDSPEYLEWLRATAPVPYPMTSVAPGIPHELSDMVAHWLSNRPEERVRVSASDYDRVLGEALAELNAVIRALGNSPVTVNADTQG